MSVRDGTLYFAPNVRWDEVDFNRVEALRAQLRHRFEGFYLAAAERLLRDRGPHGIEDFAAGLIILCAFDAIARLWTGKKDQVSQRFTQAFNTFAPKVVEGFDPGWTPSLYDKFRNGLVHESSIKKDARFDIKAVEFISIDGGVYVVNPKCLLQITRCALDGLLDPNKDFAQATKILREDFGEPSSP